MWWGAEEIGLVGSEWYSRSPTIPPDDIVAYVNLDMISRGGPADIPGGGASYLESVGSRRRSTQLAPLADSVAAAHGFQLDYILDTPGHRERVFCRSDQWNFARVGVPVVFFTTGTHADYHRVTDEPSHSDFNKHARVTSFVAGVVQALARRTNAITRDVPTAGPDAPCVQ
jgi:Zn-dependent M28 family amino/carboxypeptidase